MTAPLLSLIVAVANNGVIGNKGALPWRIPEDLRWFRQHTIGKPIIMGRKTWESLPKKPLPGRTNIVVTRNREWHPGASMDLATVTKNHEEGHQMIVNWDLASAIDHATRIGRPVPEVVVIGGAELYKAALPLAGRIYLTSVGLAPEGDVFMPPFDHAAWKESFVQTHPSLGDKLPGFTFRILDRA